MANASVVETTEEHLAHIAASMREEDVREIWETDHSTPARALKTGLRKSLLCWTIVLDDEPVAVFGVAPTSILHRKGIPWMLGTDKIKECGLAVVKQSRDYVGQMLYHFDRLENWVHNDNTISINWLRWCGFNMDAPKEYGVEKGMFRRFWKEKGV